MPTLLRRLLFLLRRDRFTREMDEELRTHLEMKAAALADAGLSESEARTEARRQFGNALHLREEAREPWRLLTIEMLVQDVRHALRLLRRDPTFSLAALATLALGIGLNTAIFTVAYGVLWQPLPFQQPDRLVSIFSAQQTEKGVRTFFTFAPPGYMDIARRSTTLDGVAAHSTVQVQLTGRGEPQQLRGLEVSPNFFDVLGVMPVLGRTFLPDSVADDDSVIVGDHVWRTMLRADPAIVGQTITIDGLPRTVVGVMPASFAYRPKTSFGEQPETEIWISNRWAGDRPHPLFNPKRGRWNAFLWLTGRLKPGVDLAQAQSEMTTLLRTPPPDSAIGGPVAADKTLAQVISLHEHTVGPVRRLLLVLLGAVGFVLLIACVNVANLQMARLSARRAELSIRSALGAGRRRLVRQLLTEAIVLALAGGALGILFARLALDATLPLVPETMLPRRGEITLNVWVLAFCIGVSALASLIVGLMPAWRSASADLRESLHSAGSRTTGDRRGERVRTALVATQMALTLVLLIGAGLLMHSFVRLINVAPGFDANGVQVVTITLPDRLFSDASQAHALSRAVLDRVRQLPGVQSASAVNSIPFGSFFIRGDFAAEGQPPPTFYVAKPKVEAGYFTTMNIPVLRGREFTTHDDGMAPKVAIVTESVARELWPDGEAIGRRVRLDESSWLTVVGVVGEVRFGLEGEPFKALYVPYQQEPRAGFLQTISFVMRTSTPVSVGDAVRAEIRRAAPDLPIESIRTMDDYITRSVAQPRFRTLLIGLFALAALSIAACGLYGLMAYAVTQRRREIGVRMALGAQRGDVLGLVLTRAMWVVVAGVALGLVAAVSLTRLLRSFLFDVTPTDPIAFAAVTGLLIAIGVLAAWLPARRAASIDPVGALRAE